MNNNIWDKYMENELTEDEENEFMEYELNEIISNKKDSKNHSDEQVIYFIEIYINACE